MKFVAPIIVPRLTALAIFLAVCLTLLLVALQRPGVAHSAEALQQPVSGGTLSNHTATPLDSLLNPDGTLDTNRGYRGSIDPTGWRMETSTDGKPRFVPSTDSTASIDASGSRPGSQLAGAVIRPATGASPNDTPTTTATSTPTCSPGISIVPSPNRGKFFANALQGMVALSPSNIWAVGYFYNSGPGYDNTLIEHWDGSSWSVFGSPNVGSYGNLLYAVSAASPNDVWAVGRYGATGGNRTLIEHWNGTAWSVVSSPNAGSGHNGLNGVAAISTDDVWAVGYSITNNTSRTLVEHWDGVQWSAVPSPNPGAISNVLLSITAVSSTDVWAAGYAESHNSGGTGTLIEHWDGTVWSVVPNPPAGSALYGISAVSATDIWAVGETYGSQGYAQTFIEHWDGSVWSVVPSADVSTHQNTLLAVSAELAGNVWAVGIAASSSGGQYRTLVEHWDGSSWSIVPSQDLSSRDNYLQGVATLPGGEMWSVGYWSFSEAQTLVERYTNCAIPPSSTVTPLPSETPTQTQTPSETPSAIPSMFSASPTATLPQPSSTSISADPTPSATTAGASVTVTVIASVSGTATRGAIATATSTPCPARFADVPASGTGSTFYMYAHCLVCRGVVSGYPCGGDGEPCNGSSDPYYRPGADVTRGQLSKIIALAAGLTYSVPFGQQSFHDVMAGDPFYVYIEQLAETGAIAGYPCGSTDPWNGEFLPCDGAHRAWFRLNNNATRGQISKIVSIAANYNENISANQQSFSDVPQSSPFWVYIERLASRHIIDGYNDAGHCGLAIPCFLYNDQATRGQMAKIAANTFYPDCQTPAR